MGLLSLIKRAAAEAFFALKPCDIFFGTALVDDDGVKVRLSDRVVLEKEVLIYGRAVREADIENESGVILVRKQGGSSFYVADIYDR